MPRVCTLRARTNLSAGPVEPPRPLEERVCVLPYRLHLFPAQKRFTTSAAFGACYDVLLQESKEIFTLGTAAALRRLVYGWVHVNKDQSVVKPLHHPLRIKRIPALRAVRAFIFATTVLGRTRLVFDRSKSESHCATPSCAKSGK